MRSPNPYLPPTAALETEAELAIGTGTFAIGRCFSDAWANTWANFPLWLGVQLVGTLAVVVSAVTVVGIFLLVPVFIWGFVRFFLNMHDGRARFGDLFSGFGRYSTAVGSMLAYGFMSAVVGAPTNLLVYGVGKITTDAWVNYGAFALHLCVTTYIGLRWSFALFLIVDRGAGLEAVGDSWRLTRGLVWKLLAASGLYFLILVAGLIALGVGLLPASTIGYLAFASAYRQVVGGPRPA